MNDESKLFLSEQEPSSGRWAILEDDGISAWLYVTEPNSRTPVADCCVYNRVPPIAADELQTYRGGPPPITEDFASREAVLASPTACDIQLAWTPDGNAAVVTLNSKVWARIVVGEPRGSSRAIARSGPFGRPLDAQ